MRNYHENLMNAVLKHVKSVESLDQWLCGNSMVVFEIGAQRGAYVGNQMLRLSGGGLIDLDPGKVTGARFQLIIREEDAELAFKGVLDQKETAEKALQAVTVELRQLQSDSENQIEALKGELVEAGDREALFNKKIDMLQAEMKETIETVLTDKTEQPLDPGSGSEDTVSEESAPLSDGPEGTEGFSDETKDKAGIV